jgi:membrane fusion protein, multidrug efflux system
MTKYMMSLLTVVLLSCGEGKKETDAVLNEKKAQMEKLKADKTKLENSIRSLQEEIAKLDTTNNVKPKLVQTQVVAASDFSHFIDLQGKVASDDISAITPRNGIGGQVKAVYIKKGDYVKPGQLVLKLDDAVYKRNMDQLTTQLAFAKDVYNRQKNLWDQNIGSEIQLLSAKNNVDQLDKQIATIKEQTSQTNVYSDVSGVVETMNIRVGEIFSPQGFAPQIQIVNNNSLKVTVDIPENYLSRVGRGTIAEIEFPDIHKTVTVPVYLLSNVIGTVTRSFMAEFKVGGVGGLRPNQLALVRIKDYSAPNAMVIPVNVVQTDEDGKYVFVAAQEGKKMLARKRRVFIGEMYNDKVHVRNGLQANDQLITTGYQNLYEGQLIAL